MLRLLLFQNVGKASTTLARTPPQVSALNSLHSSTSKRASSKHCAVLVLLLPFLSTNSHSLLLVRTGIGRTPSLSWHSRSIEARVEISAWRHSCAKQHYKLGFNSSVLCQRHNFWIDVWMTKMSAFVSIYNSWPLLSLWSPLSLSPNSHSLLFSLSSKSASSLLGSNFSFLWSPLSTRAAIFAFPPKSWCWNWVLFPNSSLMLKIKIGDITT